MQAKEFHQLVREPGKLTEQHLPGLKKLTEDFPYFQAAHMLLTIAAKKFDTSLYQQTLKRTAIVVPDRTRLFNLVNEAGRQHARVAATEEEKGTGVQESLVQPESVQLREAEEDLAALKSSEILVADTEAEQQSEIKAETERETAPVPAQDEEQVEQLEKEIGKHLVTSFVEKEILRTPDLHKPVSKPAEPGSFGDWLSFLKKNNGQSYDDIEKKVEEAREKEAQKSTEKPAAAKPDSRKLKNLAIIDRIIEKNPGLIRSKEEPKFYAPDAKAKESLLENEHLVTETLARIYALQGSVNKAVRAYEILSLKYPQKSAYFANLIEKLKNNS